MNISNRNFGIITLVGILLFPCLLNAQSTKSLLAKADKAFQDGSYFYALDYYQKVVTTEPDNAYANFQVAESYRHCREFSNAAQWYAKTAESWNKDYPLARFWYAMCLKNIEEYDKAAEQFQQFANEYKKGPAPYYKKKAAAEIQNCKTAKDILQNPMPVNVENLGPYVNTKYSDFAVVPYEDGSIIITSARPDSTTKNVQRVTTNLYIVKRSGNGWSRPESFGPPVNSSIHDGNGCLSSDGKKFYFTRCTRVKDNEGDCVLYVSEKDENGTWSKPEKLGGEVNLPKYVTTDPCIVSLGKKGEILYFASNRPGGRGGWDLWYSAISPAGEISKPQNLGSKINTSDDESSPFYHTATGTLYFSSSGHPGLGGMDIFKTEGAQRKWGAIENLGLPLNSSVDDVFFVLSEDSQQGFLTSNRKGGFMAVGETCCEDIYSFVWTGLPPKKIEKKEETAKLAVNGLVIDSKTKSSVGDADVVLIDAESGTEISIDKTVKDEMFLFDLQPDKKYKLKASAPNYLAGESNAFNTLGKKTSETLRMDVPIEPLKVDTGYVLKNIYYDFNKATLRPESMATLDSLVMFLNQNPNMEIEIGAHTDNKGTDEYNITLSQARAKSVVDYLISKEIPKKRLSAKGYGETKPITTNDTDEGRQLNRRTEFKIIKMQ